MSNIEISLGDTILWVHERSGLTWKQLGRVFGKNSRTVHSWAFDHPVSSKNEQAVRDVAAELEAVIAGLDDTSVGSVQQALLASSGGPSILRRWTDRHAEHRQRIQFPAYQWWKEEE